MEQIRDLRADEIKTRVQRVTENGCELLLYKDARCDMRILDETFGAERWQRKHEVINGNLYCSVGVKFGDEWVWKQDVGKKTIAEEEKGIVSDSFKRCCTNWGVGRELYTSPFIWISADNINITKNGKGKPTTYDKFSVKSICVEDKAITSLEIVNTKTNKVAFKFGVNNSVGETIAKEKRETEAKIKTDAIKELSDKVAEYATLCEVEESDVWSKLKEKFNFDDVGKLTIANLKVAIKTINTWTDKTKEQKG